MNFLGTSIMLPTLYVPEWVRSHQIAVTTVDSIPSRVFKSLSEKISEKQSDNPLVSIGVIAFNEEKNILTCLSSLAAQKSVYPFEIIVCNNNSTDHTQELLDKCGVRSILETRKGVGHARQALLVNARGKYLLNADADIIYPETWAEEFVRMLEKPGIVGVYNVESYLPDEHKKRFGLSLYEIMRDISYILRGAKRPELCVGGCSFGFPLEQGRKIGWKTTIRRGEDGSMAFELKKFGKLKFLNNKKTRFWTAPRSLSDGTLPQLVIKRLVRESRRIKEYFIPEKVGYRDREENLLK